MLVKSEPHGRWHETNASSTLSPIPPPKSQYSEWKWIPHGVTFLRGSFLQYILQVPAGIWPVPY